MREWSSGVQTDFTNYAAARLAERGMLREDDPARLQRAVMDIAMGYARGGSVDGGHVPADSPLPPDPDGVPLKEEGSRLNQGWIVPNEAQPANHLADQRQLNDSTVQQARNAAGVGSPNAKIDRGPQSSARTQRASIKVAVEKQRSAVNQDQQTLNQDYNLNVDATNLRRDHGGNPAVWSTVGAGAANRSEVGKRPAADQVKP
jgi:hypothetical protein